MIECAKFFIKGLSAKEIAKEMNLSPRTIETFIVRIKQKLSCTWKTELTRCLLELGIDKII